MNEQEVLSLFQEIGVIKQGHFKLSSGRHSDIYLQCAILQQYPELHSRVLQRIADSILAYQPTVIVGAAVGGVVSSYELARLVGARGIFAERVDGILKLRRGFELIPEDRVVVIEDVVTTAKTTIEIIDLVKVYDISPKAVATIVDRRTTASGIDFPFFSAIKVSAQTWTEEECPLCMKKIPINEPGSRRLKNNAS
jgi:orotate phosphoribosyltransferase